MSIDLNEHKVQIFIRARFKEKLETIDKSNVSGFMKLWLYQHYLLSQLAWLVLVLTLGPCSEVGSSLASDSHR